MKLFFVSVHVDKTFVRHCRRLLSISEKILPRDCSVLEKKNEKIVVQQQSAQKLSISLRYKEVLGSFLTIAVQT